MRSFSARIRSEGGQGIRMPGAAGQASIAEHPRAGELLRGLRRVFPMMIRHSFMTSPNATQPRSQPDGVDETIRTAEEA